MNPILNTLQEGPKPYDILAKLMPKEALDCSLLSLFKRGEVIRTEKGYALPPPPLKDKPLPKTDITPKGICYCGNNIYRKGIQTCSRECQAKLKTKPRKPCAVCGGPIMKRHRHNATFCSRMCRYKWQRGMRPFRKSNGA